MTARYRSAWSLAWGTTSLLGVCLALLVWAPGAVLLLFTFAAATACVVFACGLGTADSTERGSLRTWLGIAAVRAAAVGSTVVAIAALGATAPLLLLVLVLLAGATSPYCAGRLRARLADREQRRLHLLPNRANSWSATAASTARALTDHDLCQAWATSFETLQTAPDVLARSRIVSLRQAYLDELDRRDPRGLCAWLTSGARATGNPERFLSRHRPDQQCDE